MPGCMSTLQLEVIRSAIVYMMYLLYEPSDWQFSIIWQNYLYKNSKGEPNLGQKVTLITLTGNDNYRPLKIIYWIVLIAVCRYNFHILSINRNISNRSIMCLNKSPGQGLKKRLWLPAMKLREFLSAVAKNLNSIKHWNYSIHVIKRIWFGYNSIFGTVIQ